MATITLKGTPIETIGNLPKPGDKAPNFTLVSTDMSRKKLADFSGQNILLNIFPSIDTGTCAASVRKFNEAAANLANTKVLCISRDLPFAQARFCGAEGIANVIVLSDFISGQFGKDYGLEITNGPIEGLHSRCVIIIDKNNEVIYTEQVAEVTTEPNYQSALKALQ
ncbi:MAG: thiol peroxidase [Polaribacter sp.]|nr:thiol peroxidase [Polaribacter sp.]